MKNITAAELKNLLVQQQVTLVDIRDNLHYSTGHIANAINLEVKLIDEFAQTQDPMKTMVIYCYHGVSSIRVAQYFAQLGFKNVLSLQGGYSEWPLDK